MKYFWVVCAQLQCIEKNKNILISRCAKPYRHAIVKLELKSMHDWDKCRQTGPGTQMMNGAEGCLNETIHLSYIRTTKPKPIIQWTKSCTNLHCTCKQDIMRNMTRLMFLLQRTKSRSRASLSTNIWTLYHTQQERGTKGTTHTIKNSGMGSDDHNMKLRTYRNN